MSNDFPGEGSSKNDSSEQNNPTPPPQAPPQQPYDPNRPPPQMMQGQVPPGYQGQGNPYSAPQGQPGYSMPYPPQNQGDATGGMIPYKNPQALIAYYLGIVSLLPLIGLPFGIAALILGIIGLKKRKENPAIKGSVHAWIGIAGGIFSLICGGLIGFSILAAVLEG